MKILLLGATGLLGNAFKKALQKKAQVISPENSSRGIDIRNVSKLNEMFRREQPNVCVNAVAISDPTACEKSPNLCKEINVIGTKNIVRICKRNNCLLVFFSTDYIFNGSLKGGYHEQDKPSPLQLYGKTKVEAESYVSKYENSLIVRLPFLYGSLDKYTRNDFVKSVLEKMGRKQELNFCNTQIRYPTFTYDVVNIVWLLIKKGKRGLYHISTNTPITKYQWAKIIAKYANYPVNRIKPDNKFFDRKKKPLNSHLVADKLKETIYYKFLSLDKGTKKVISSLEI